MHNFKTTFHTVLLAGFVFACGGEDPTSPGSPANSGGGDGGTTMMMGSPDAGQMMAGGNLDQTVPYTGNGKCAHGGGEEYEGTYSVTVNGQKVGPFTVYGIGAEATNFSLVGCGPVRFCARGSCVSEFVASVVHRNLSLNGNYTGDRVIANDATQTMTVQFLDGDTDDRSASGSGTVTTWDFENFVFAGSADVTTASGRSIQVEWNLRRP